MVKQYRVSTTVVRQAISVLRSEGLVQGQQGKGVFVCEALPPIQEADQDDEFRELIDGLNAVTSRVDDLTGRIARLEDALFPGDVQQRR
jgi:DNA-binding GntR family transcriptional regulator